MSLHVYSQEITLLPPRTIHYAVQTALGNDLIPFSPFR
jgi:hypothetical protein